MSRPLPVPIEAAIKDAEETNGMREAEFEVWLDVRRGLNTRTVGSRISNCRRVEAFEGNLDDQYDTDGLAGLIERLTYSREDARHRRNPKHKVPIDGDIYNGTATLKSVVGLYRDFRSDGGGTACSRPWLPRNVDRKCGACGVPGRTGRSGHSRALRTCLTLPARWRRSCDSSHPT